MFAYSSAWHRVSPALLYGLRNGAQLGAWAAAEANALYGGFAATRRRLRENAEW